MRGCPALHRRLGSEYSGPICPQGGSTLYSNTSCSAAEAEAEAKRRRRAVDGNYIKEYDRRSIGVPGLRFKYGKRDV